LNAFAGWIETMRVPHALVHASPLLPHAFSILTEAQQLLCNGTSLEAAAGRLGQSRAYLHKLPSGASHTYRHTLYRVSVGLQTCVYSYTSISFAGQTPVQMLACVSCQLAPAGARCAPQVGTRMLRSMQQ
jgi:hypothetical protein